MNFGPIDPVENSYKSWSKPQKMLIRRNFNPIWRGLLEISVSVPKAGNLNTAHTHTGDVHSTFVQSDETWIRGPSSR